MAQKRPVFSQANQYPQSILSPKEQAAAGGGGELFGRDRRSKRAGWFLGAAVAR